MSKHFFGGVGFFFISFSLAMGCAPAVKTGKLAPEPQKAPPPAPIKERTVAGAMDPGTLERIGELNRKAGAPSFAMIGAYYQLPVAMPAGAATIERGTAWGQPYESVRLRTTGKKDWALEPTNVEEAQMLEGTLRGLMDAGVQMKVIEMADAQQVMTAEQAAASGKGTFFPNLSIQSGADVLLSIQRGEGLGGRLILGRAVRTKDGALVGLATQIDAGPISLRPLMMRLVEDSLNHIANAPGVDGAAKAKEETPAGANAP
jgi:hypothetical protein